METANVALVAPASTVTLAGTVAAAVLLLESATTAPVGAAIVSTTVAVDEVPPTTSGGMTLSAERCAVGVTTSTAHRFASSCAAEMVSQLDTVTGLVVTVKVANVAPAGTVTKTGTLAAVGSLLPSETVTSAGAVVARDTFPDAGVPAATVVGLRVTDARRDCWDKPVGSQDAPPSMLLNTPTYVAT